MYRSRCISVLFLFQRLIYVGLRQQRMTAIGKEKLLAVVVEDVHVRDTALKIGHIVHGILGILAVAKNFVLMLQQFGLFHTEHIDPLLWGCNGRCFLAKPCKAERVRLTLCFHYQSRQTAHPPRAEPCQQSLLVPALLSSVQGPSWLLKYFSLLLMFYWGAVPSVCLFNNIYQFLQFLLVELFL